MKKLFWCLLLLLIVASFLTVKICGASGASEAVLFWTTDNNPARALQISNFQKWLVDHGHAKAEMLVDSANSDGSKKIIQGVSGVAGDVVDCGTGNGELRFYVETGIVEDLTEAAKKLGFGPDKTYPSIVDDLMVDGKQYVFPCNVASPLYFINLDAFKKAGVEPPSGQWTLEEFEALGKKYTEAVSKPGERRELFFCSNIPIFPLARSFGGDIFNETMTASAVKAETFKKSFELVKKWTFEDHLIPTAAEQSSFSTQSGYGGASTQLFSNGNYALLYSGRYLLIQFRQFGAMNLDAVEPPNGGFRNTEIGARAAFVYKGGKHKEQAILFLAYLASKDYNMNIVADADSLPPNPAYTKIEEYLRPKQFPNEWRVHGKFADAVDIAIVQSKSPYIANSLAYAMFNNGNAAFMSNVATAGEALSDIQSKIDNEILRTVKENPKLQESYKRDCEAQKKIDELKAKGEKIPLRLIKNPFYRKYYQAKGMVE